MSTPSKPRYPLAEAKAIASELEALLAPCCERIIIAGSIRRGKATVGDIELLYIPRTAERQLDMFARHTVSLVDELLDSLVFSGVLCRRLSVKGTPAWGAKNKLAAHVNTGIPVDFFATTERDWHNALVCRTGPTECTMRIATEARSRGWQWHAYGAGFSRPAEHRDVTSERAVFEFVGLPYREPQDR